ADATTGRLYQMAGTSDAGTAIAWHVRTPSFNAEDARADKLFGDIMLDANPSSNTLAIASAINNYATALTISPTTMTGAARTQQVYDISSGVGAQGKNIAVDISGSVTTG